MSFSAWYFNSRVGDFPQKNNVKDIVKMKKLMLLLAVFAGISMLSAAELSADGWIKSQMQGKFVFTNPGKYPISMKCDEPSAGSAVKAVCIWG